MDGKICMKMETKWKQWQLYLDKKKDLKWKTNKWNSMSLYMIKDSICQEVIGIKTCMYQILEELSI